MKKNLDFDPHEQVYNELAERRAIAILGLSKKEAEIARAYETTKVVELDRIKREALKRKKQNIEKNSIWDTLLFIFK
ncbi:hypothetical protein ACWE42_15970 [Sutcliffiella cohnii]